MDNTSEEIRILKSTFDATGSLTISEIGKSILYPLGKYLIRVNLTDDNKFIGITEIGVNKDFLDYKQKLVTKGIHDVDEFYSE